MAALALAALLLATAGTVWFLWHQLDSNIHTDTGVEAELRKYMKERPDPSRTGAENVLIIGTDRRSGSDGSYGRDTGTARSDTVILMHLAAGRRSVTAVSIPRDLMVRVPRCTRPDGSRTTAGLAQFNWAFSWGGTACTIRTVEQLTGVRIDHHVTVDFTGFKKMVDAVGGVEVCTPYPIHDKEARLDLPAGRQMLDGEKALGYVRARHGFGDGSDTERMDRQQAFLASLLRKTESEGVLLDPAKLYPVLDAATSSLSTDPGLNSMSKLYDLVSGVQDIPMRRVRFLTVPREPYPYDVNRDQLVQPQAAVLFAALRDDRQVAVQSLGPGLRPPASSPPVTSPPPGGADPTYRGTTADHDICHESNR
ncbi:LCP family protein [Streptomyces sp. RB6PN25]|uniref:LCP family protein n=2 Tax=Streptomyces humicola TaxID=2953240 RepID=A0ABT1Q539_9ACTN|nr:LCP family protein [Streptomyces humicola]MCQ4085031.1 LCP family protein [Streptomyces humicola]